MKRIALLLSLFLSVCLLGFGLAGCSEDLEDLALDRGSFEPTVEYGAAVDLSELTLVYGEGEDEVRIPVTPDMVSGDLSTDTVGRKNLLIRYEGRLVRFSFDVKYSATFMAGDTVIGTVYVGEGEAPLPPSPEDYAPSGMEFVGWSPALPTELADNAVFTAQFAPSTAVPTLSDLSASYGQTLGELTLPSSAVGAWQFVDTSDTPVGEIGTHSFAVRFMPSDPAAVPLDGTVTVTVGKARIEFADLADRFVYDGTEKFPTYTVPEGVTVIELGTKETDAGRYDFTLLVNDPHYEGVYTGSYTIEKAVATVTLPDYELSFDEARTFVPTTYTVTGLDEALLGKVTVLKPTVTGSGAYSLSVMIEKAANVDVTVAGGALTVTKSTLSLTPPTLADGVVAHYGDTLSSLALSAHGSGRWSWKDASLSVDRVGTYTATAIFTPTNTAGYESAEVTVTFPVSKKVLPITVNVGAPVYNGAAHTATYTIANGEYNALGLTVRIRYNGAEEAINAGVYTVTAELLDERYEGSATAQMIIAKATPAGVDFSTLFDALIWSESPHTLGEITLPSGYSWVNASTAIPDTNIGTAVGYPALFTPADTENYAIVSGEFKVLLNRAPAAVTGDASHSFVYNATSHTLVGLYSGSHNESEIEFYDQAGNRFDFETLRNVGSYEITVVLPQSAHYARAERTVTVTVTSGEFPDKTAPTGLTGIYSHTLSSVSLPADPDGVWSWQNPDERLDLVGKKTVTAIFTPTDTGYSPFTAGIELTVGPKPIPIPTATYEKTYNGQRQPAGALGGTGYAVIDNGGITVGTYPVIYTLTSGNYVWEDGTTENKSVLCFTVTKAENAFLTAPTLNKYEWKYDEEPAALNSYAAAFGVPRITLKGEAVTEIPAGLSVGEYTLTLTVEGTDNYEGIEASLTFTVKKGEVEIPTLAGKVYNGSAQSASLPGSALLYEIKENVREVNVGTYAVTLTLADPVNYEWKNREGDSVTVDFAITKAPNNWNIVPTISKTEWTYGQAVATLNAYASKFGTAALTLNGEAINALPTSFNAGEYTLTVSVADTADFAGLTQSFSFTVKRAEVAVPTLAGKPYTGEAQGASLPLSTTLYEIKVDASETNAGTYEDAVTLTLTDPLNYVWKNHDGADVTVDFAITKAENAWTEAPSVPGIIFGGTISPVGTPKFGTVTVEYTKYGTADPYSATKPTAQGTYHARFTVKETDNYAGLTALVSFSIAEATNTWVEEPTVDKTEWTYGDAVAAITNGGKASFGSVVITLDGEIITEIPAVLSAGTHTLAFLVEGTNDYTNLTKAFRLTVAPKAVTAPTGSFEKTYNGQAQTAGAVAGEGYTVEDLGGTNAGTYKVTYKLSENYIWSDGTTADKSVDFVILPKAVTAPTDSFEKTYNGQAQKAGAVAGEGYTAVDLGGTNAGTYKVYYKLSANYIWSDGTSADKSVDFVISPKPISVPDESFEKTYTGSLQKAGAEAGEGYTVEDLGGTKAGTYSVTYKLKANYVWADETSDDKSVACFTIKKFVVELPDNATAVYTGSAQSSSFGVSGVYTAANVEKTDVDEYSITLTLTDPANYEWENSKTSETATVSFSITKADNAWTVAPSVPDIIYGGTLLPIGEAKFGNEGLLVKYKEADAGDETYTTEKPTEMGAYIACFTVADDTNYAGLTATVSFSIAAATNAWVNEPTVDKTEWTYGDAVAAITNGGKASFGSVLITLDGAAVTEIPAVLSAGTHTLTFLVEGTNDYTTLTKTFTLTVAPKADTAPTDSFKTTYNGSSQIAGAVAGEGYTVEDLGGTNAGTYTVTYKLSENYIWSDGTSADKSVDFVILPKAVTAPADSFEKTYNGESQKAGAVAGEGYTVVDNGGTNAGTYAVYYKLSENYIWSDGTSDDKSVDFVILPKKVTAPAESFEKTYNGQAQKAGAAAGEGYTVEDLGGTNAGTYAVTYMLESANYIWSDGTSADKSVDFVILPKKVTAPTGSFEKTYNGQAQKAGAVAGEGYTVEDLGGTNAGTYAVTYTLESANYIWSDGTSADKTVDLVIQKAEVAVPTLDGKPYNGKAQGASLSAGTTLYTVKANVSETSVGTYPVTLTLTDPDNYVWKDHEGTDVSVDFVIEKADNAWTVEPTLGKNSWAYGSPASLSYASAFGSVTLTLNGEAVEAIPADLAVGDYTLTVSVGDDKNYSGLTEELTFSVTPAIVDVSVVPTVPFGTTYSGVLQTAGAVAGDGYTVTDEGGIAADTYTVVYALESANYIWSDGTSADKTVDFVIAPFAVTLPTESFTTVYNGKIQTAGASSGLGYIVEDLGGREAGTYPVVYKLMSANFIWRDGTTADKSVDCFTITKADNLWINVPAISKDSWKYGEDAATLNDCVPQYGPVVLTLNGKEIEKMPAVLGAGEYVFVVSVTETDSYAGLIERFSFTVEKAEVEVPTFESVTYNGEIQNVVLPEEVARLYYVKTNVDKAGVGNYKVILALVDPDSCSWKNENGPVEGAEVAVDFSIERAENIWTASPTLSKNEWKYGEAVGTPGTVSSSFGTVRMTLNGEPIHTLPTAFDVGSYTLAFTVDESVNYNGLSATLTFTVEPGEVRIPSFNVPYNGNPQGATLPADATLADGKTLYTIKQNVSETAVGTYSVVLSLSYPDNYTWVNGEGYVDGAELEIPFVIEQAENTWTEAPTLTKNEWRYNEAAATLSYYTSAFGTPILTLNGTELQALPESLGAGEYTLVVSVEGTDNYTGLTVTVLFTVKPAIVDVSVVPVTPFGTTYNGQAQTAGATSGIGYTVVDLGGTNAGSYSVTYKLESANYIWSDGTSADKTVAFVIAKKTPTVLFQEYTSAVYQNNLSFEGVATGLGGASLSGSFTTNLPALSSVNPYFTPGAEAEKSFTYTVTFTPDNANYATVSKEITVTLKAAAYIGSTYYGSIEDALDASVSGDVVWVMMDANSPANGGHYISRDCTVKANVVLVIPYAEGTRNAGAKAELEEQTGDSAPTTTNLVTVKSGVTITVLANGTLEVGGQLRSANADTPTGCTDGNTARLVLGSHASIVSGGIIKCYGFIDEDSKNNGSSVTVNAGGKISMPFIIYDFRGGTATSAINSGGKGSASVFNRFAMLNVAPTLVVNYGGEVWGMANIYADDNTHSMEAQLVGDNASTAVIQLTDSTYSKVIAKLDVQRAVTHLRVIGGARTNGMSISVVGVTANTKDFAFAIGYNWDIVLEKADGQSADAAFEMGQLFKLMPGAKLTVSEGTVLNIQNEKGTAAMNVYPKGWEDRWTYTGAKGGTSNHHSYTTTNAWSKEALEGGMLLVYGTLNADILGGNVYVYMGGTANITTKKCTTTDLATTAWGLLGGSGTFNTVAQAANIIYALDAAAGTAVTLPSLTQEGYAFAGWYTAPTGGTKVGNGGASYTPTADITLYAQWTVNVSYTVTLNANGGTCSETSLPTRSDGTVTLPTPTRDGYTFNGWYTAASKGTLVSSGGSYTPTADITLYAQWTKNSSGGGCVTGDTLVTLADGSQKALWHLQVDDDILAYDFYTGKFTVVKAGYIVNHGYAENTVITLYFDDGTVIRVVNVHGFFDVATREFIFVRADNVDELIGRAFSKQDENGSLTTVKLIDYSVSVEYIEAWSVLSSGTFNCLLNGMLALTPPEYGGNIFMPFEVGEDMKIDEEKMQTDIETYGLYTYEEWSDRMPREIFDALNIRYLKITIGKGILTEEEANMLFALHFGI